MDTPGDDTRSAWNRGPEIIAAEQRILTYADALLTWMRSIDLGPVEDKYAAFFTHESYFNPAVEQIEHPVGTTKQWLLDKLDPDTNRFFLELLRAAWERRCWRTHYGEITSEERDRL
jgi:hypothetical protein